MNLDDGEHKPGCPLQSPCATCSDKVRECDLLYSCCPSYVPSVEGPCGCLEGCITDDDPYAMTPLQRLAQWLKADRFNREVREMAITAASQPGIEFFVSLEQCNCEGEIFYDGKGATPEDALMAALDAAGEGTA